MLFFGRFCHVKVDNLSKIFFKSQIYCLYLIIKCQMGTNGSQILPMSDRQVRPLAPLEPEQQRQAWQHRR